MNTEKIIKIWVDSLLSVLEGKSEEDKQKILKKLVEIFKKQKKEYLLPEILERTKKIFYKRTKIELIFSREQESQLRERITKKLLDIFGKDKSVETRTEKELIGGFQGKTENFLIKASIKDFLTELKTIATK